MKREDDIKWLRAIIKSFEEKNWLKMATSTDLATYVVDCGFRPTQKTTHMVTAITEALELLGFMKNNKIAVKSEDLELLEEKLRGLIIKE